MTAVVWAGGISLLISLFGTPLLIRYLTKRQYGQFIRQDGPESHHVKRGTPTMGGLVIIAASVIGWLGGNLLSERTPNWSSVLVVFLMVGLGFVGFLDDAIKISRERSLGLKARWKFLGQAVVGITFGVLALQFPNAQGITPASPAVSFLRDTALDFAVWGPAVALIIFVIWSNFLITAWSNAVNLTDGLDGLATGAALIFFGAYILVGIWQLNQLCGINNLDSITCYEVRDPRDLAILAAAIAGACFGFLWWNASPAKIFMGDTGSLALGGAIAGITILTRTEILGGIIGGLFVLIVASSVIQIGVFKLTGKRVFKMAPLHHHFELMGWGEVTIVTRFWIIAGLFASLGIGIFYAEWVSGNVGGV